MTVSSETVQGDFLTYFIAALHTNVSPALSALKNFEIVQDGDALDANAQSAKILELKNGNSFIRLTQSQKSSNNPGGRCYTDLQIGADTPELYHALLKAVADGFANVATRANSQNWRDNAIPTLTAFSAPVDTVAGGAQVEITLAELKAQGDEADSDGTVDGFVVQAVSAGTLKIGPSAALATDYAAGLNDVIDASNNAYYTVPAGVAGAVNAFTVKAMDNDRWLSASAIQVQVTRT